jgi:hypothetical protein
LRSLKVVPTLLQPSAAPTGTELALPAISNPAQIPRSTHDLC